jgi:hypothetical protein
MHQHTVEIACAKRRVRGYKSADRLAQLSAMAIILVLAMVLIPAVQVQAHAPGEHSKPRVIVLTSTQGERIVYQHGRSTVNGRPWPLKDYALYKSPLMNAAHGSGLITLGNNRIGTVTLDFRDSEEPIRIEKGPR